MDVVMLLAQISFANIFFAWLLRRLSPVGQKPINDFAVRWSFVTGVSGMTASVIATIIVALWS